MRDRFRIHQFITGIERASTVPLNCGGQPTLMVAATIGTTIGTLSILRSYQTITTCLQTLQVDTGHSGPFTERGHTTIPHLHCLASVIFLFLQLFELSVCVAHLCAVLRSYCFFILFFVAFCFGLILHSALYSGYLQVALYVEIPCTALHSCPRQTATWFIRVHSVSCHPVAFSFRFVSFRFRFVSFHFVSFRFVSFRFVSALLPCCCIVFSLLVFVFVMTVDPACRSLLLMMILFVDFALHVQSLFFSFLVGFDRCR